MNEVRRRMMRHRERHGSRFSTHASFQMKWRDFKDEDR